MPHHIAATRSSGSATSSDAIATRGHSRSRAHAHAAPGRARQSRVVIASAIAVAVAVAGIAVATAASRPGRRRPVATRLAAATRDPAAAVADLTGSATAAAADLAGLLFSRAPVVVVTSAGPLPGAAGPNGLPVAAAMASRMHAPLLLAPPPGDTAGRAALLAAVRALRPRAVLASGLPVAALATDLPGVRVVGSATSLPATTAPPRLPHVALLEDRAGTTAPSALNVVAATTARVAGADVVSVAGYDPRTDPAAISALAAARPRYVIGVGAGFGSVPLLAGRITVAETGAQLPGGGQVLFPGREIVALYGTPGSPALGALGQQNLAASIARAKAVAAQYSSLTSVPVVPAFEIIASVATAGPGPSGLYSDPASPATLRPWVMAAISAGLYVTLDLQPGRASLLAQAQIYQSLLRLPDVGLALDPEWQLQPGQLPLHQIGSVSIAEVNSVANWLAALTTRYDLPQKLLELHEFRLSMIRNIGQLDTGHDSLAIVINMDGQGGPIAKQQTWQSVTAAAPSGVFFGWKDFYVKDTPMLGPRKTIGHYPTPVLISYE